MKVEFKHPWWHFLFTRHLMTRTWNSRSLMFLRDEYYRCDKCKVTFIDECDAETGEVKRVREENQDG